MVRKLTQMLLLTAALAIPLAACGGGEGAGDADTTMVDTSMTTTTPVPMDTMMMDTMLTDTTMLDTTAVGGGL